MWSVITQPSFCAPPDKTAGRASEDVAFVGIVCDRIHTRTAFHQYVPVYVGLKHWAVKMPYHTGYIYGGAPLYVCAYAVLKRFLI